MTSATLRLGQCFINRTLLFTRSRCPNSTSSKLGLVTSSNTFAQKSFPLSSVGKNFNFHVPNWLSDDADLVQWGPDRLSAAGTWRYLLFDSCLNGKDLYRRITQYLRQSYIAPDPMFEVVCVLYIFMTYVYTVFGVIPYLHIIGEPATGKSVLARVFQQLAFNAQSTANVTPAAMYRLIRWLASTLIFDEQFQGNEAWTRALRVGNRPDNPIMMLDSTRRHVESWDCFTPKIFLTNDPLTDGPLRTRTIQLVSMPSNIQGAGTCSKFPIHHAHDLRDDSYRFALQNVDEIQRAYSSLPQLAGILGRERDLAAPLLSIAACIDSHDGPDLGLYDGLVRWFQNRSRRRNSASKAENERLAMASLVREFVVAPDQKAVCRDKQGNKWYLAENFRDFVNKSDVFEQNFWTKSIGEKLDRYQLVKLRKLVTVTNPELLGRKTLPKRTRRQGYLFNTEQADRLVEI